jgi:lysophospholipase L1-like esterase
MRILFQGDSITDGHRSRDEHPSHCLGHGFVYLVAAELGARTPAAAPQVLNRGVSGDKIEDLARRWKRDALALRPDALSMLVGVNDVWHRVDAGRPFEIDDFARRYRALLAETAAALPALRLILCEPFFLPGPATADRLPLWRRHLADQQELVARLAAEFGATLVRFQPLFDRAAAQAPATHWLWDGVHPTPAGHRLMADEWLRGARELLP